MHTAIIHIGSNLGKRREYLAKCRFLLQKEVGNIKKSSQIYQTEAWGLKNQSDFLNQAFVLNTPHSLEDLFEICQGIEQLLDRKKVTKWGPRTIDIDIIFYDDLVVSTDQIEVPHPRMHQRNFVLHPLSEIVPEYIHPVLKKSVLELKHSSKDLSHVSI